MSNADVYKVWDKENNQWYLPTFEAYAGKLEHLTMSERGELLMITLGRNIHESVFPERFKIAWNTGLSDSHGNSLYSNDVCVDDLGNTFLVFWSEEYGAWSYLYYLGDCREHPLHQFFMSFKRIGSLYEDENLLGE